VELLTILIIIAAVIALILFITLIKNIIKIALFTLGLVVILSLLFGLIAYIDAQSIKKTMETGAKTLIYTHEGEPLIGLSMPTKTDVHVEGGSFVGGVRAISKQEIQTAINNTDLVITIDEEWLWSIKDTYTVHNTTLSREDANNLFASNNQAEESILGLDQTELKAFIFFSLFSQAIKEADTQNIIKGIREETITIQPSLISTNIIKLIPEQALSTSLKETIKPPTTKEEDE
jgi:hypothetical protein